MAVWRDLRDLTPLVLDSEEVAVDVGRPLDGAAVLGPQNAVEDEHLIGRVASSEVGAAAADGRLNRSECVS